MLSRSSSISGSRLRRTRSSSSFKNGRPRCPSDLAPASQHQALTAANLAFERARGPNRTRADSKPQSIPIMESRDDTTSRINRRRSSRSLRTSSGYGFGGFAMPKTNPAKRDSTASFPSVEQNPTARHSLRFEEPDGSLLGEGTTPSKRSARNVVVGARERSKASTVTKTANIRKSKSMYGWNTNISSPTNSARNIIPTTMTSVDLSKPLTFRATNPRKGSIDYGLAQSQDDRPEHFNSRRLRHRASFMLTPFKKRSDDAVPQTDGNVAQKTGTAEVSDSDLYSGAEATQRKASQDSKTHTGSIKNKISRFFRRSSAEPISIPAQQVEASRHHFNDLLTESLLTASAQTGPRSLAGSRSASHGNTHTPKNGSRTPSYSRLSHRGGQRPSSPTRSEATAQTKSRVSSWADSTIAGTVASNDSHRLSSIKEDSPHQGRVPKSEDRAPSVGSNFLRRLMRKSSRVNTGDHGPSVECGETVAQSIETSGISSGRNTAFDSIASQGRSVSQLSTTKWHHRPTVRSVSPDHEPLSESKEEARPNNGTPTPDHSSLWRPRNRLRKKPPAEAALPSAEQLAARAKKDGSRWKGLLEDCHATVFDGNDSQSTTQRAPPAAARSGKHADEPCATSPECSFTAIREPASPRAFGTLSPSIYSQSTDAVAAGQCADRSSASIISQDSSDTGTAVIITSQPIYRYALGNGSPHREQKAHVHVRQPSNEWQSWLSREMAGFGTSSAKENISIGGDWIASIGGDADGSSRHHRERTEINGDDVCIGATRRKLVSDTIISQTNAAEPRRVPSNPESLKTRRHVHELTDTDGGTRSASVSNFSSKRNTTAAGEGLNVPKYASNVSLAVAPVTAVATSTKKRATSEAGGTLRPRINSQAQAKLPETSSSKTSSLRNEGSAGAENRPPTRIMADRFPMIDTGRPTLRNNIAKRSSTSASTTYGQVDPTTVLSSGATRHGSEAKTVENGNEVVKRFGKAATTTTSTTFKNMRTNEAAVVEAAELENSRRHTLTVPQTVYMLQASHHQSASSFGSGAGGGGVGGKVFVPRSTSSLAQYTTSAKNSSLSVNTLNSKTHARSATAQRGYCTDTATIPAGGSGSVSGNGADDGAVAANLTDARAGSARNFSSGGKIAGMRSSSNGEKTSPQFLGQLVAHKPGNYHHQQRTGRNSQAIRPLRSRASVSSLPPSSSCYPSHGISGGANGSRGGFGEVGNTSPTSLAHAEAGAVRQRATLHNLNVGSEFSLLDILRDGPYHRDLHAASSAATCTSAGRVGAEVNGAESAHSSLRLKDIGRLTTPTARSGSRQGYGKAQAQMNSSSLSLASSTASASSGGQRLAERWLARRLGGADEAAGVAGVKGGGVGVGTSPLTPAFL